jgi:hypothetical protein
VKTLPSRNRRIELDKTTSEKCMTAKTKATSTGEDSRAVGYGFLRCTSERDFTFRNWRCIFFMKNFLSLVDDDYEKFRVKNMHVNEKVLKFTCVSFFSGFALKMDSC